MITGTVFDIQHFCVDDGPGIRTTVFLKGCPLRCIWCHNAEGLSTKPQLYYNFSSCVGCGRCEDACDREGHRFSENGHIVRFGACIACGSCAATCPNEALRITGKRMTAEEVLEDVLSDVPFYKNSGGGMTLSGGEPLLQGAFSAELARMAREQGLHVCVETSGFGKKDDLMALAENTDLFLFDFKHSDPVLHQRYTGVDNTLILSNLCMLGERNKPVILRCPIIPDCNDSEEHYRAIAELANEMDNINEIHLEPYHPFGVGKYASVGLETAYDRGEMMSKAASDAAADIIRGLTDIPLTVT